MVTMGNGGMHTRATLRGSACARPLPTGAGNPLNAARDGDWGLGIATVSRERGIPS